MKTIDPKHILSISELQKLSIKKLRTMDLGREPLFVVDRKSGLFGFVILDYRAFERLLDRTAPTTPLGHRKGRSKRQHLAQFDYRGHGLFWDRPSMTNEAFDEILSDPGHADFSWAAGRTLERLTSEEICELISLDELETLVERASVRPSTRKVWRHALDHWHQTT